MDPEVEAAIRQELLGVRASIDERRAKMAKHVHHREEPIPADFSEQAVAMENDETVVALDEELSAQEKAVNKALARLESGEYGSCTKCGNEIQQARLEALPATAFCIDCAE